MSGKITLAGQTTEEYCRKYPSLPSLTLAKLIYKENPSLYKNLERTTDSVRYVRGLKSKKRNPTKVISMDRQFTKNPWDGFESDVKEPVVFKLPRSIKKVLVLSDIHIPYHNNVAIKAAIDYGRSVGVDCVFINGDLLDFYQLSSYEKDPRKRGFKGEIDLCRQFFDILNHELPKTVKYFIPGNHCFRWERYMYVKAPELLDMEEFRLDIILKMGEKKINYLPHGSDVYFGKLLVEHGDKLRGSGGVNPARTAILKFKRSVLIGHFHRTTSANSVVYKGESYMAWSTGHLGDPHPEYLPVNDWNHGFAIVEIYSDETFKVDNLQIINGKVF